MSQQTFSMTDVVQAMIDGRLGGLYHALPGTVLIYDAATQKADIQPAIKGSFENERGNTVVERLPVVKSVPVMFPGGGAFRVTSPIHGGDSVLLIFASCSLDRWLSTGREDVPVDQRRHTLTDAFAIPNLRPFTKPFVNPTSQANMSVGMDDGPTIEITPTQVRLGAPSASESAIRGDTYRTREDTYLNALEALLSLIIAFPALATYIAAAPGGPGIVSAFATARNAFHAFPEDFLSPIVKVA